MTTPTINTQNNTWKHKTFSFLVRSRQELWGKKNEDIMAWFFLQGLSNKFVNESLLGWNRHAMIRPVAAWHLPENEPHSDSSGKFSLPPGIVIPDLEGQEIVKLLIFNHQSPGPDSLFTLPGSATRAMIWGNGGHHTLVVFNAIHALFLAQELGDRLTVILPDHRGHAPDTRTLSLLSRTRDITICSEDPFQERDRRILGPWGSVTDPMEWLTYTKTDQILDRIRSI